MWKRLNCIKAEDVIYLESTTRKIRILSDLIFSLICIEQVCYARQTAYAVLVTQKGTAKHHAEKACAHF